MYKQTINKYETLHHLRNLRKDFVKQKGQMWKKRNTSTRKEKKQTSVNATDSPDVPSGWSNYLRQKTRTERLIMTRLVQRREHDENPVTLTCGENWFVNQTH